MTKCRAREQKCVPRSTGKGIKKGLDWWSWCSVRAVIKEIRDVSADASTAEWATFSISPNFIKNITLEYENMDKEEVTVDFSSETKLDHVYTIVIEQLTSEVMYKSISWISDRIN